MASHGGCREPASGGGARCTSLLFTSSPCQRFPLPALQFLWTGRCTATAYRGRRHHHPRHRRRRHHHRHHRQRDRAHRPSPSSSSTVTASTTTSVIITTTTAIKWTRRKASSWTVLVVVVDHGVVHDDVAVPTEQGPAPGPSDSKGHRLDPSLSRRHRRRRRARRVVIVVL